MENRISGKAAIAVDLGQMMVIVIHEVSCLAPLMTAFLDRITPLRYYEGIAMVEHEFTIDCPEFYSLYMTCHSHGWKNLAPFSWDQVNSVLRFACLIQEDSVDIVARQQEQTLCVFVTSKGRLSSQTLSKVALIVRRCLGLDTDTSSLLKVAERVGLEYAELVRLGAGRLLRSATLWEDAAKTLFTTNCSWSLTKKMCHVVCSNIFSTATPSGAYPFPTPSAFTNHSASELKELMPVGYRSPYLKALAERFVIDPELGGIEGNGIDTRLVEKIVGQLFGFGPYATAHLMVLTGSFRRIPVDSVVVSYLNQKRNHRIKASSVESRYEKWHPFQWWGLKLEQILLRRNWLGD